MVVCVYLITKPGSDVDGEDRIVEADSVKTAHVRATELEKVYNYKLTFVGTKEGIRFTPALPYEQLPFWAKRWIDEQTPKHLARPAKARGRRRVRAA